MWWRWEGGAQKNKSFKSPPPYPSLQKTLSASEDPLTFSQFFPNMTPSIAIPRGFLFTIWTPYCVCVCVMQPQNLPQKPPKKEVYSIISHFHYLVKRFQILLQFKMGMK